jgi:L-threonylcarbamoyladenylate synthase
MSGSNTLGNSRIFKANESAIAEAAKILRSAGIVAVPTETVYGLAADASSTQAVAAIYMAKGRPDFNPLIVHVPNMDTAKSLAMFDERAERLANMFWPGPLSMVLPLKAHAPIAKAVTAGLSTIALRCPAHPVMQRLMKQSGLCLAAPSANRSGAISPTTAAHVSASFGADTPMVLDAGPCATGLESTIVKLNEDGWQLLRQGPITQEDLTDAIGCAPIPVSGNKIEAPGQLASHYAPAKPLRLNAHVAFDDEWHIGFGAITGDENLSEAGDAITAAARLFAALHRADQSDKASIAVAPMQSSGIGAAIQDRLNRAAASK